MSCAGDHCRAGPWQDEHEPQEAMHLPGVASDATGKSEDESKAASVEPANQLRNTANFAGWNDGIFSVGATGA